MNRVLYKTPLFGPLEDSYEEPLLPHESDWLCSINLRHLTGRLFVLCKFGDFP